LQDSIDANAICLLVRLKLANYADAVMGDLKSAFPGMKADLARLTAENGETSYGLWRHFWEKQLEIKYMVPYDNELTKLQEPKGGGGLKMAESAAKKTRRSEGRGRSKDAPYDISREFGRIVLLSETKRASAAPDVRDALRNIEGAKNLIDKGGHPFPGVTGIHAGMLCCSLHTFFIPLRGHGYVSLAFLARYNLGFAGTFFRSGLFYACDEMCTLCCHWHY